MAKLQTLLDEDVTQSRNRVAEALNVTVSGHIQAMEGSKSEQNAFHVERAILLKR